MTMTIGQIVDYTLAYNERQKRAERQAEREQRRGKRRKATQKDIDAFFG